jgi:hypothetical protein
MNQPSIEQELRQFLTRAGISFVDQTTSFKALDFTLLIEGKAAFYLEVKEKRQPYNMNNWPKFAPEVDLFILDDLTIRKCIGYAPRSGILVRDNMHHRYYFFSVIDLALMPRMRLNRTIQRQVQEMKGKWLVNLQNSTSSDSLAKALVVIEEYVDELPLILDEQHSCYGRYVGEEIGSGGVRRNPEHWQTDIRETR